MEKRAAIITGASSGIGWEFALQLGLERKLSLILVARRANRLQALAAELRKIWGDGLDLSAVVLCADLRIESERERIYQEVTAAGFCIELLVNNAGFGTYGPLTNQTWESQRDMIEVNIRAPLHLTFLFSPQMIARRSGAIVNVCSVCSFQAIPYMSTYAATKAFLLSHSISLLRELEDHGVRTLALCPGPTDTEFHITGGRSEKIPVIRCMSVKTVVSQALQGLEKHKPIVVNGVRNRILTILSSKLPPTISTWITKRVLQKYM